MPKVKTLTVEIRTSGYNKKPIVLKFDINLNNKTGMFSTKNNEIFLNELNELEIIEGKSIKEINIKLHKMVSDLIEKYDQFQENNLKDCLFVKWDYSFENDEFNCDFCYVEGKETIDNVNQSSCQTHPHSATTYSYFSKKFYLFEKKLRFFHKNDGEKYCYVGERYLEEALYNKGFIKVPHSQELIQKLEYVKYFIDNFNNILKEILSDNKNNKISFNKVAEAIQLLENKKDK